MLPNFCTSITWLYVSMSSGFKSCCMAGRRGGQTAVVAGWRAGLLGLWRGWHLAQEWCWLQTSTARIWVWFCFWCLFGFQIPARLSEGEERKAASGCVMVVFRMGIDSHQKWGMSFSVWWWEIWVGGCTQHFWWKWAGYIWNCGSTMCSGASQEMWSECPSLVWPAVTRGYWQHCIICRMRAQKLLIPLPVVDALALLAGSQCCFTSLPSWHATISAGVFSLGK